MTSIAALSGRHRVTAARRVSTPFASLAMALAMGLASPVHAHDFWIFPADFRPVVETTVGVDIMIGHAGAAEVRARDPRRIVRFVCREPGGEVRDVPGVDGARPAGLLRPRVPGTHVVGYESTFAVSELPAERFEKYLREEGLERIVEDRAARGASGTVEAERYMRCAKCIVEVGPAPATAGAAASPGQAAGAAAAPTPPATPTPNQPGAPSASATPPPPAVALGLKLELVPRALSAPPAPGKPASLSLQLLHQGRPVEGVRVALKSPTSEETVASGRTGPDGLVDLAVPRPGPWMATAVHMVRAPEDSGAVWESMWASLTLTVDSPS